ncbi:MAG: SGNH/GDSL hydrolase family protein [Candidatus Eremiobacterota bacterium]
MKNRQFNIDIIITLIWLFMAVIAIEYPLNSIIKQHIMFYIPDKISFLIMNSLCITGGLYLIVKRKSNLVDTAGSLFIIIIVSINIFRITPVGPGNILLDILKLTGILLNLYFITKIFYLLIVLKDKKINNIITNISLVFYSLICIFFIMEAAFIFIEQLHGSGYSLASQIWYARHFTPVNTEGFRDREFSGRTDKKIIFLIGDSFVAGQGIKNFEDRFSNILEKKLNNYSVFNLGVIGLNTRGEFKILSNIYNNYKPDLIILSYFCNDIGDITEEAGTVIERPYTDIKPYMAFVVTRSYLCNYIYWQFPHSDFVRYEKTMKHIYRNKNIINLHLQDLQKFVDFSNNKSVPLAVIIFPYMQDVKGSKIFIDPIRDFFKKEKVPVLDISDFTGDIPGEKLVVSKKDFHPNEYTNKIVADKLYEFLIKNMIIKN